MRPCRPALIAGLIIGLGFSSLAAAADKVFKFNGSATAKVAGKEMLVVSLISAADGRKVELPVPNKDPSKMQLDAVSPLGETIKTLKSGDWVLADVDTATRSLKKIAAFTPAPHELTQTGYTMGSSYKTPNGLAVQLTKLGESVEAVIGTVKSDSGTMVSDPMIEKLVDTLKKGDAVDAELTGSGKKMTIVSLALYKEPEEATFEKSTEADLDGQKVPAVELQVGGKAVTAIVAGKMGGKKWTPDKNVTAFVKRLKENADIMVTTSDVDGKTYLRRVTMAKKSGGSGAKDSAREKPEKKAKDAADAKK